MGNKTVLFALALLALPPCAGIAAAADRLNEGQMDRVTAGALTIECPNCGNVSMSSGSMSVNGVTTNTSSSSGGSGSGSSGGSGNSGNGTSLVPTTVTVPANIAAELNAARVTMVVTP